MSGIEGKTVVITGASAGTGAAAARELRRRGALVVPVGRSAAKTAAVAAELGVRPFTVDFASLDDVRRLGQELLEALPRIDALAANAGAVVPGVRPPTGSSRRSRSARGCSCACWRPTKTSTVATSSTGALL